MPVKKGDEVSVHYVGTFADGTEFDSSRGRSPLRFKVGSGQVIPGFDRAVMEHEAGDSFTVTIPAADAYGESNPEAFIPVPRDQIPANIRPEVGMRLQVATSGGELEVVISSVTEREVVLDANHPMAGKDLTFALEIVSIN